VKEFAEGVCRIPEEVSNLHFRSQHIVICGIIAEELGLGSNLSPTFPTPEIVL
jgi:hypothetical protein